MGNIFFTENLYPDVQISLRLEKKFIHKKTPYQDMVFARTKGFGNALFLDGIIQTTEKDEFIYHEMMTHPALLSHPKPENILIIGGGDGGILREALKHKVKKVTMVEIDKDVIEYSKLYLKSICRNSFKNKKLRLVIDDGANFIR